MSKEAMLATIWFFLVVLSIVCGALTGKLSEVTKALSDGAANAVQLALGMIGIMTLWLGLMHALRQAGLFQKMARLLQPMMIKLFPMIPVAHPAMSMMLINFLATMLGLANAATPFGLKAMQELQKLNKHPKVASNAQVLFLAINTSGLAVVPTSMIALRSSLGSAQPGAIFIPTLIATSVATIVAVVFARLLEGFYPVPAAAAVASGGIETTGVVLDETLLEKIQTAETSVSAVSLGAKIATYFLTSAWIFALVEKSLTLYNTQCASLCSNQEAFFLTIGKLLHIVCSEWCLLLFFSFCLLWVYRQGVNTYEAVVEGGKEGFAVAQQILPYLVAILTAVSMFRASGALALMTPWMRPLSDLLGLPAEAIPMALIRPLSGSGAYAVAAETMEVYGPDSFIGYVTSTLMGSSETTFYLLAVYCGSVRIIHTRHAVVTCLLSDIAGVWMSALACKWLLS